VFFIAPAMRSKEIIHIIDSLGLGGAEILLQRTIALLPEWKHTVIYLDDPADLKAGFPGQTRFVRIGYTGLKSLPLAVLKLRKEIKRTQPQLVHAHLLNSSLLARLAVPRNIPLVQSLHSIYSIDSFLKNRKSLLAERLTTSKRHALVAVSKFVLDDYRAYVPFKGKGFVLYNFLPDHYFKKHELPDAQPFLRCIAVGNLKSAKNYGYLLEVFRHLTGTGITLDIYGTGTLREGLQAQIDRDALPVRLCGVGNNLSEKMGEYNLFIQASEHEGFGLSVIEAMAAGVPAFVSDIPVFREITGEHAHFFPLNDAQAAAKKLALLAQDSNARNRHIDAAYTFSKDRYNAKVYREQLLQIYNNITNNSELALCAE
jgi:glycosyltransferase involved in cell wall biosynthesis